MQRTPFLGPLWQVNRHVLSDACPNTRIVVALGVLSLLSGNFPTKFHQFGYLEFAILASAVLLRQLLCVMPLNPCLMTMNKPLPLPYEACDVFKREGDPWMSVNHACSKTALKEKYLIQEL